MTGKQLKCLLIDDDEDDHEIFRFALQAIHDKIVCDTASNGYEGLQKLTEPGAMLPAYIFLDLNMPGMNGKECLTEIKRKPSLTSIPVIIYSTSALTADIEETKQMGAQAFISKPANISDLINELKNVIK